MTIGSNINFHITPLDEGNQATGPDELKSVLLHENPRPEEIIAALRTVTDHPIFQFTLPYGGGIVTVNN